MGVFDTFNKVRRWGQHPGRMLGLGEGDGGRGGVGIFTSFIPTLQGGGESTPLANIPILPSSAPAPTPA